MRVYEDLNTLKALVRSTRTSKLWRSFRDFPRKISIEAHKQALNFIETDVHKGEKLLMKYVESKMRRKGGT